MSHFCVSCYQKGKVMILLGNKSQHFQLLVCHILTVNHSSFWLFCPSNTLIKIYQSYPVAPVSLVCHSQSPEDGSSTSWPSSELSSNTTIRSKYSQTLSNKFTFYVTNALIQRETPPTWRLLRFKIDVFFPFVVVSFVSSFIHYYAWPGVCFFNVFP